MEKSNLKRNLKIIRKTPKTPQKTPFFNMEKSNLKTLRDAMLNNQKS